MQDWESESEEEEEEQAAIDEDEEEEVETSELEVEEEIEQVEEEVIGEALGVQEEKPVQEPSPTPPSVIEKVYKLIFTLLSVSTSVHVQRRRSIFARFAMVCGQLIR